METGVQSPELALDRLEASHTIFRTEPDFLEAEPVLVTNDDAGGAPYRRSGQGAVLVSLAEANEEQWQANLARPRCRP